MKKEGKQNFTKLTRRGGISLIVLVITIIVILILAATIIINISNNNPIKEANIARYENDVSNIQDIFTATVAKVMAQNRGVVKVKYGQINSQISGVKETTGEVSYTVVNPQNSNNADGKIIFNKGKNTDTEFYIGKQLPIYAAGETKWYVDNEGIISLKVAEEKYGVGKMIDVNNITMISGTEFKDTIPDTATVVMFTDEVAPFGYSINAGNLVDVSQNSSEGVVAWLDGTTYKVSTQISNVEVIANEDCSYMFYNKSGITDIELSYLDTSNVGNTGYMFSGCTNLKNIDTSLLNISSVGYQMFYNCKLLTKVDMPLVTKVYGSAFQGCLALADVNMPLVTYIGERGFQDCSILSNLDFPQLSSVGYCAFQNTGATIVKFPNLTSTALQIFNSCHKLTHVYLPKCTGLDNGSLNSCSKLVYVDGNFNWIHKNVFAYSNAIKTLVLRNNTICTLSGTANLSNLYIYVPKNLIEDYKVAEYWSSYADKFRALEDYTVDGTVTGEFDESKI